jgi:Tol biopolymer transport system component
MKSEEVMSPPTLARVACAALASLPLFACSATVQRAVNTTEAATQMEQVTRSATNELDPAISPDAKTIAYEVADSLDAMPHVEVIALKDAASARPGRIEYSSARAMGLEPAWMPDGSRLVFVSNALGPHKLVETIGDSPEETRLLGSVGDPSLIAAWPAVSRDGTVAMTLGRLDLFESGWRSRRTLDSALGVSDIVGSGIKVLGEGTDPAWSPDGSRIVFSRKVGSRAHLFVMNADGTDAQQITEGPDDDVEPSFSPDGNMIVFCSARAEHDRWTQANLFAVRPDGTWLVQLTEGDRFACRPDWAKDGYVYFHANATDHFHIWRLRPTIGRRADSPPALSPSESIGRRADSPPALSPSESIAAATP